MKRGDSKRFAKCMEILRVEFTPGEELAEMQMEVKYKALEDLTIEQIEGAVWGLVKTRKTASFPKVGEIRGMVTGDMDERGILAYEEFRQGKERTGIYKSVIFEDRVIHAVIQSMGGWIQVCQITEEEWRFRRREFIDLYKTFSNHLPPEIPESLVGLIEFENLRLGFEEKIPYPVLIGGGQDVKRIGYKEEVR